MFEERIFVVRIRTRISSYLTTSPYFIKFWHAVFLEPHPVALASIAKQENVPVFSFTIAYTKHRIRLLKLLTLWCVHLALFALFSLDKSYFFTVFDLAVFEFSPLLSFVALQLTVLFASIAYSRS